MNNVPFFTSISHDVHHGSVGSVDNLKCPAIKHDIRKVIIIYSVRELNAVLISVDIKFKNLKDRDQAGVKFNMVSKK